MPIPWIPLIIGAVAGAATLAVAGAALGWYAPSVQVSYESPKPAAENIGISSILTIVVIIIVLIFLMKFIMPMLKK